MEEKLEIRTDLLRQLADHLLNGKLGHKKFNFSMYNSSMMPVCGTSGCAIGECPIVWPDKWEFSCDGDPILIDSKDGFTGEDAMSFFGINEEQYHHLFFPCSQSNTWGPELDEHATKQEVAENILRFCELAESGKL